MKPNTKKKCFPNNFFASSACQAQIIKNGMNDVSHNSESQLLAVSIRSMKNSTN